MGGNKKGRAEALPIRTLTGYGAQVARQRCPILRASATESTMQSFRLKAPGEDSYSSNKLEPFRGVRAMVDPLTDRYQDLLDGSYDCVDRIVVNAYFSPGHNPGGFREWWRRLFGSEDHLDNTHLKRMAGRFSRRLYAFARKHGLPVVRCAPGERKHEIAEEYLITHAVSAGLFLITVSRAPALVWKIHRSRAGKVKDIERPKSMPFVNHYSFHIWDEEWGHVTIKISGHPPFAAQIILNGHEYVASRAKEAGVEFTKEGNCFTHISDAAGLGRVADTLSAEPAIGRLTRVCERWIYTCLNLALDSEEQTASGFRYQYSVYQVEYSRNLLFQVGGQMEKVFQALVDRTRAPLDVRRIKTILGCRCRLKTRPHKKRASEWSIVVEKPVYNLTLFKVHCGYLTLKVYTKGEHVLRIEAIVHDAHALRCCRSLPYFPLIVSRLQQILKRFLEVLSSIDACFIEDGTLERLPLATQLGTTRVAGIDFNRARVRHVAEAVLALSPSPSGFTASQLASKVCSFTGQTESAYGPRHAAYDLKKFRAKELVRKIESTRRYEPTPEGLRTLVALWVLRDKVIKPLLAAASQPSTRPQFNSPGPLDQHYRALQRDMQGLFQELGLAA
jgi:hypothetical protein